MTETGPKPIIKFNEETVKAIKEIEKGGGTTFTDAESFFIALEEE